MCITKSVFRWGLISGLALGGATLLIGPERVACGLSQIRYAVQDVVDSNVDNPVALRRQLEGLASQYPDRLAEVRGQLAEVNHEIAQIEGESGKWRRVVALATDDLSDLRTLVARAETQASETVRPVSIRFEGVRFSIDEAYNEARRINNVRTIYSDRVAHNDQQMTLLGEQKTRLSEILTKLESEYETFQAQLWQLDRQIDAIERNDRLIELTEEHQARLASYEKFGKVGSLKQLQGRLAQLRAEQEAQLQHLAKSNTRRDYEERAEMEMSQDDTKPLPSIFDEIEIEESTEKADEETKTMAFAEPIVIE